MTASHTVPAQVVGYFYQCVFALKLAIENRRRMPEAIISIERFDDVAFSNIDEPALQLQLKHKLASKKALTNGSTDLWSTLDIWLETYNPAAPQSTLYFLITTETAPSLSAAHFLRAHPTHRQIEKAANILTKEADNNPARKGSERLLKLDKAQRNVFLGQVFIIDKSPDIIAVYEELRDTLWPVAGSGQVEEVCSFIEGWWYKRVIEQLSGKAEGITVAELEHRISDARHRFSRNHLPILYEDAEPDTATVKSYQSSLFVQQLELVELPPQRISLSMGDYFRALQQRGYWSREQLLIDADFSGYDNRLRREWQRIFYRWHPRYVKSEIDDIHCGQCIYDDIEDANIPIRPECTQPFVSRGSFHLLADTTTPEGRPDIWWHPEGDKLLGVEP